MNEENFELCSLVQHILRYCFILRKSKLFLKLIHYHFFRNKLANYTLAKILIYIQTLLGNNVDYKQASYCLLKSISLHPYRYAFVIDAANAKRHISINIAWYGISAFCCSLANKRCI